MVCRFTRGIIAVGGRRWQGNGYGRSARRPSPFCWAGACPCHCRVGTPVPAARFVASVACCRSPPIPAGRFCCFGSSTAEAHPTVPGSTGFQPVQAAQPPPPPCGSPVLGASPFCRAGWSPPARRPFPPPVGATFLSRPVVRAVGAGRWLPWLQLERTPTTNRHTRYGPGGRTSPPPSAPLLTHPSPPPVLPPLHRTCRT